MLLSSGSSYRPSCYTNTCATHSASTPSSFWAWVPCSPEAIVSTTSPQTHPSVVRCHLNNADTDLEIKCVYLMWNSPPPPSSLIFRLPYAPHDLHERGPFDLWMYAHGWLGPAPRRGALRDVWGLWDCVPTGRQAQTSEVLTWEKAFWQLNNKINSGCVAPEWSFASVHFRLMSKRGQHILTSHWNCGMINRALLDHRVAQWFRLL